MRRRFLATLMAFAMCATVVTPAIAQPKPTTAAPAAPSSTLPSNPKDETKVPHYFGPYSNWANSPQVLADAIVAIAAPALPTPVVIGNQLIARTYATDTGVVFGVVSGTSLQAGTLSNFQVWNQADPTAPSAGNTFHAYVLRPTLNPGEYTVAFDSGLLTMPALADPLVSELATFAAGPFNVLAGDVIAWYGQGIPLDVATGTDQFVFPAPAAPVANDVFTLGTAPFVTDPVARTYSIAATVVPPVAATGAAASATVDPKTGGISAITVTDPGSGYTAAPAVTITSPGVVPTALASATAQISPGVVNAVTVYEAGFGFTAPQVVFTGGNPTTPAIAQASGGVDDVTLVDGGSGYVNQPTVVFDLPNLGPLCAPPTLVTNCYTRATGTATMNAGVVNGVTVTDPGSGYTAAPGVTILDAGIPVTGTAATVTSTIGIAQVDVTSGGTGYDAPPTVAILDGGTVDRNASALATVAVRGAVTGVTVTAAGSGYLTPGLKKFVDTLPGLGPTGANNYGEYIPVAVPDTTTYPGADYYEIALVQYRQQFSSQMPATLLRGYVQLSTSVVPGAHMPLTNATLDPAVNTPIAGYFGVDKPHYLGPTIVATKDRPVRVLFRNLLPTGVGGDLFLPTDTSLMGSGMGPNMVSLGAGGVPNETAVDNQSVMDGVRNPVCGQEPKPAACFSENRATLHLHGGITPWISDGTPHQWTTPAGEATDYPEGVSVSNVPDMPDPGPGALTFFYTNQQSARLMFYHDHAWGITRLNVYAGEAAPYLVTDATEQALLAPTGALAGLGIGTPLVIQDKTFVSDNILATDPTWDASRWGGTGSLWTPHVYMPAQNPGDPSGMSAFGRWMYGPWFWPPAKDVKYPPMANPYYDPACDPNVAAFCEPALIPSTPNISVGMEAFNDTPVVNGTAYPTTTVDPKAYRYRILNAANDRFWNLQWYVADPTTGTLSEVALKPAEVAAAQLDPNVFPTPDLTKSPAGPSWIQIGTEGGFLPAPVVVPNQPITWITDPTRFDVGNVDQHSLLLAPAERADVVVDFSQFRGKTLILYNDAPAAFPARVSSYDYYTGGPDLSPVGAPTTLAGYGPNTRTIMQVKVSTAAPAVAFDRPNTTADRLGALMTAFAHHADGSGVFESGSDPIIVGQAAYNGTYGTNFVASGWCNSPTNPTAKCDGFARISEQTFPVDPPATPFAFKFDTLGPLKDGNGAQLAIPFQPKGMHDEMNSASFDEWGRMTANLGLEAPGATPLLQNIILFPYVNPPTDNILDADGLPSSLNVTPIASAADGTQIWKITHNGVDTHPIHFHLYDVQVLNRVTWDNIIMPPDANELGWKDTVRVSPLEDTIVAVRPIVPTLPFAVPDSRRPMNPAMPIGAAGDANSALGTEAGFNNTDNLGNPIDPIINAVIDFGWEYVYHCHILSHEEMDMMRPVKVIVTSAVPPVVNQLPTTPGSVVLHWDDPTPVNYADPATWAHSSVPGGPNINEIGFKILRANVVGGVAGTYAEVGRALANATTWSDTTGVGGAEYSYVIEAFNEAGSSAPSNSQNAVFGLDVIASNTTIVFGDPVPTITYSYLPTSPLPATNPTSCTTTYTVGSGVGTYPSICAGIVTPDPVYGTSITYIAGTVTVTPKPLTITGLVAAVPFGSAVPTLTPTYTGLVAPDVAPATPPTCTTTYTPTSTVAGSPYAVTCTGAADPNYTFTYVDGAITVTPASVAVTAPSFTVAYGAAVPGPLTPTYLPAITPATPATCTTAYTPTSTVAGSPYAVDCSGAADPNYTFTYVAGAITVTPAAVVVTGPTLSVPYGSAVPVLTPTYNPAIVPATSAASCTTTYTPASSVAGSPYAVTCSGAADPNYTFTYVAGAITVTPAAVVVTGPTLSVPYGSAVPVLTPTYNPAIVPATSAASCTTTYTPASSVAGSPYAVTCSGAADPNYTFTYVAGAITVTPVALTIIASNGTMVYGGAPPAITPTYSGFIPGDSAASLTTPPTCGTVATNLSPVGVYPSTCSGAVDPNYTISYTNGTVIVGKAALAVFAPGGTMAYGGPVLSQVPSYVGFVNTDTAASLTTAPTCAPVVTATSPVGPYLINCSGAAAANYTFVYIPGTITVTAAPVTVTAFSGSMAYGSPVPALIPTYAGLKNGAIAPATTPTCTSTVTSTSPVGTYPSTCAGAADPNYTFTYVAGTITVTKAATTVTVTSNVNPSVHGQSVTFTATVHWTGVGVVPTGTIQLTNNGAQLGGGPRALNAAGVVVYTTPGLTTASHAVIGAYSGDVRYLASTSPTLTQVTNAAATTTTLTLTTPVSRRNTIRYTARVTTVAPGTGTATGTVRFYRGNTLIGSATLSGAGVATLNYRNTALAVGVYSMHAIYAGSTNWATSTSPNVSQRVTL